MNPQEYAVKWKFLKEQVKKVNDPVLQKTMMAEFRKRAYNEWGFDPESTKINSVRKIELDDWEKELLEDIKNYKIFGFNVREEKMKKERTEAKARMKDFILKGGCLKDIPEDIRSNTIKNLYYECLLEYGDEIMEEADKFIAK